MINQLNLNNKNNFNSPLQNKSVSNNTNFRGRKEYALKFIQTCEKQPILNVALIDLITAIIPRTIWESIRNVFAGLEAFRRESSGLIINCLIPGFITLGYAKLFNKTIMGKGNANLANCWASSDTLNNVSKHYEKAESTEAFKEGMKIFGNKKHARVYAVNYNILSEASGLDGFEQKQIKNILSEKELSSKANLLTRTMFKTENGKLTEEIIEKTPKIRLKAIFHSIAKKTHIAKDVQFENGMVSNLDKAITDTHQIVKGLVKENIQPSNACDYLKRAKKLLKTKSILGMLTILPLAASMQFINRKITEKTSGMKGAPIHEDFGKKHSELERTPEQIKYDKKKLLGSKVLAVTSMFALAMLSMLKLPTKKTLKNIVQFKDQFPTMDQARAISAVTFASRMAAADDKIELKEHRTRDMITFASMYFLGDYGAKATATYLEKKHGVQLLNRSYNPDKNTGIMTKFKNWVLNTHLKSSDELKGIGKELKFAKKLRGKAQLANLGTSLALLGVIVPLYTMSKTKKLDREEKTRMIIEQSKLNPNLKYQTPKIIIENQQYQTLQTFKKKVKVTA